MTIKIGFRDFFCLGLLAALTASLSPAFSAEVTLVPAGATWTYLDDGTDQGTAWRATAFVDIGWAGGPAQLGYGDSDEATVVGYGPEPGSKYITTYFRHAFDVADVSQYACLEVRLVRDDGGIVYLNGEEIWRANMPAGTVDYLTLAAGTVGGDDESAFQVLYVYPEDLVTGTNVLAVEVHQVSATSSDISFDLELVGHTEMPTLMRKAPYLIYAGTNTEMKVMWQTILTDTSTIEWGTDLSYSLGSAQTVEYGGDHQHTYTIAGLTPGMFYYYRVTLGEQEYTGSFHSAPAPDANRVKFFAYGDTRTYPADHDLVAAAIVGEYIADTELQTMIVSVGDLVSDGDFESYWDTEFFDPAYTNIQAMLANLPYQVAMGNHEGYGVLFVKYFPYPFVGGRYWSFDYGPAHFVIVDQYTTYGPGSAQLTWIENDLAASTKPWKFVCLHEPGWSAGGGHENNTDVQNYIQPLCEQYDVPIVFAGHNHYYARAVVNGVHHITTGGGGAPLRSPESGYPYIVYAIAAYNYCKVEIDGGILGFTATTRTGTVIDTFSVYLPGAGVGDGNRRERPLQLGLDVSRPNPFSASTGIAFSLPEASDLELAVYEISGRKVRTLADGLWRAGRHTIEWDGKDDLGEAVASGIYLYRLEVGSAALNRKAVLAR
jgi:hypothetical protein